MSEKGTNVDLNEDPEFKKVTITTNDVAVNVTSKKDNSSVVHTEERKNYKISESEIFKKRNFLKTIFSWKTIFGIIPVVLTYFIAKNYAGDDIVNVVLGVLDIAFIVAFLFLKTTTDDMKCEKINFIKILLKENQEMDSSIVYKIYNLLHELK